MFENYYIRPVTVDRIRSSWIAAAIEQYVGWLAAQGYSQRTVLRRVPLLVAFGEFAKSRGVTEIAHLPEHVEPFVQTWIADHTRARNSGRTRRKVGQCVRNPIRQMLRLAIPDYVGLGRPHKPDNPFETQAPRFLAYLTEEKGLRPRSILQYRFHLRQFAAYLEQVGIKDFAHLSPTVLGSFIAQYGPRVAWPTLRNACGTLRVFLRYLHREGVLLKDLSSLVEFPQSYRHAAVPRSISWEQVEQVLAGIDRRSVCGKRDYAMLLLLATYGLRACEVAALTLDDLDWRNDRLRVRDRKAGNSTTYPLSPVVGAAIIDYIKNGRPPTKDRQIFLRICAPLVSIGSAAVTCRAAHYIRKAGIKVPRAGSHTIERGNTYYVLFAVLYGLGLRVGEACRLRIEDVDLERRLLVIRETKFYKSRLVPFGPKLDVLLAEHLCRKQGRCPDALSPDQPLFCLRGGRPVNPGTVSQTFHQLIPRLHLMIPPGTSSPRLHDLRHSFAVGALTRWYRLGLDPQTRLLALATFLGHVDINSTAIYLTTTQTLLDQANQRFEAFAAATLKGGLML